MNNNRFEGPKKPVRKLKKIDETKGAETLRANYKKDIGFLTALQRDEILVLQQFLWKSELGRLINSNYSSFIH